LKQKRIVFDDSFSDFSRIFRHDLYQRLEYSADEASDEMGTMVAGDSTLLPRIWTFANLLSFGRDWAKSVRDFVEFVKPIIYLFRVNWQERKATNISIYCRLLDHLSDNTLSEALECTRLFQWAGPSPQRIGEILGIGGPTGIGLRINNDGQCHTAMYYRVGMFLPEFRVRALKSLVECCGFPDEVASCISVDMATIYPPSPVGVVGIDSGKDSIAANLKLDPAEVSLRKAFAFISRYGATSARIAQLASITHHLRMSHVSYIGTKYNRDGFAGWKLYWSIQPRLQAPALGPILDINQPTILRSTSLFSSSSHLVRS
jgi:hypothetical protein